MDFPAVSEVAKVAFEVQKKLSTQFCAITQDRHQILCKKYSRTWKPLQYNVCSQLLDHIPSCCAMVINSFMDL
jgi:hypothetical protein